MFANKYNEAKINERNNFILLSLVSEQSLFLVFNQILSIHLYSNKQIKECLISTCGVNALDENLNEIKGKVFDWFIKLMNIFYANFSNIDQLHTHFVFSMRTMATFSAKSLLFFCINNSANFQSFIEHKKNENCLIKLLNLVNKCTIHVDYFETIFQFKTELVIFLHILQNISSIFFIY